MHQPGKQHEVGWLWRNEVELAALVVIGVGAMALRVWPLGGYAHNYDEGIYWQCLRAMARGELPFRSVYSSQPQAYLLALLLPYLLLGQTLIAARVTMALYSLVALAGMYCAGKMLGGRWAGIGACALLAVQPLFLRQSYTVMAEMPALAFACVAVALAIAAGRHAGRWGYWLAVGSGVALAFGVLTKLLDVAAIAPVVASVVGSEIAARDGSARARARAMRGAMRRMALLGLGVVVGAAVVTAPYLSSLGAIFDQAVGLHLTAQNRLNRGIGFNLTLIIGTARMYGGYALAGMAGIAVALALWRRSGVVVVPVVWLVGSVAVVLHQQPLYDHHVVALTPPLALLAGLSLSLAWGAANGRAVAVGSRAAGGARASTGRPYAGWWRVMGRVALVTATLVMMEVTLAVSVQVDVRESQVAAVAISSAEQRIVETLDMKTTPGEYIVSDDQFTVGLANRDVPPELTDTSEGRIESGNLTSAALEAVILRDHVRAVYFGTGRFDLLPDFVGWVRAHFKEEISFGNGQRLYLTTG
ncbi:MAG: hypothetical protein OJF49_002061 [Ktedonobacterales bacterium]|nr:MAG: hypothetical protein OJF49_002061 [Ktedonobacterales bacterium]